MEFKIVTDTAGLNNALFQVTHGLYILTAFRDKPNGQCLDSCMQVTSVSPKIAIGVGKNSLTHKMIYETGLFVVNVLDRECPDCLDKIKHFGFKSGREFDKFENMSYKKSGNGIPILEDSKAFFECRVIPKITVDLKTHSLFIADVVRAGTKAAGEPLTYNEYRKIKLGGING